MGALLLLVFNSIGLQAQKNVGINTADPKSTLEIKSTGNSDASSALDVTDANGVSILHVKDSGKVGVGTTTPGAKFMVVGGDGAPTFNILNNGSIPMNPAIRVNDNGRVGIGTTAPGARFMIVGENGAPTLNVLHDGANGMNPSIRVNDNGRVGIGTTAPGARFMVVGEAGAPTM